jgi:excisionase family DNA binding protein
MSATLVATAAPEAGGLATVKEAAEYLTLSKTAVYELAAAGKLRHCRLPGTGTRANVRIPWEALREFVSRSMIDAEAAG